jgi:hypothetical protein
VQPLLQWKSNKYYIFSVCVCSLSYPHAMRVCHIVNCDLSCSTIFFHVINGTFFGGEKKLLNTKCVFISYTTFVWNISHSENWARYDQKCRVICMESTRYSCPVLMKIEFSRQFFFRKILTHLISRKSVVTAESFHADRRTDMTKLTAAYRNFTKAPKNRTHSSCEFPFHSVQVFQITRPSNRLQTFTCR